MAAAPPDAPPPPSSSDTAKLFRHKFTKFNEFTIYSTIRKYGIYRFKRNPVFYSRFALDTYNKAFLK